MTVPTLLRIVLIVALVTTDFGVAHAAEPPSATPDGTVRTVIPKDPVDAVLILTSVDLTARTGHVAMQMAQTKIKDPSRKLLIILIAVGVGVYLWYALTHLKGGITLHSSRFALSPTSHS
jgi:hypothetical protein